MKKTIYIWFLLTLFASIPVIASCSLTGACSPVNYPDFSSPALQDKYIPNNLNNIKNPLPQIQQNNIEQPIPINTGLNNPENVQNQLPSEKPYNSACQFGTCLP